MTDLINRLLEYAICEELCPAAVRKTMKEAATRLEELEERVAILTADLDRTWGESYCTSSGAAVYGAGDGDQSQRQQ